MQKKNMRKKKVFFYAVVLSLLAVMGMAGCGKEEGYRNIQVYEVNGRATIERENVGSMDAYENLNLLSGDWMGVAEKSYTRLKVDNDKYLFIEAGSELSIIATGTEKDAKTNIHLEKGAVTVEVQNKLAEDASFEVTTPNSVMAIRGTVVRIAVDTDEKGEPITAIAVLEGKAAIQKIEKDGTISEEQVVEYGKEAVIYENEETDIIIDISEEVDMTVIPSATLEFLKEIAEERRELVIPVEELKQIIEEKKVEEQKAESIQIADSTEILQEEDVTEERNSEENNSEERNSENRLELPKKPSNTETSSENSEEEEEADDNWWDLVPSLPPEPETPSIETPEPEIPNTEVPEPEIPNTEVPEPEIPNTEVPETETPDIEIPAEKQKFTVTFKYNGKVFGTQTVEEGQTVSEPTLRPALTGGWNFNFSTPITADTVIEFVE